MGVKVREDKKGSGFWYIYINHQGKRKAMKVGPKQAALKLAKTVEADIAAEKFGFLEKDDKLLFKNCQKIWIEDILPATWGSKGVRVKLNGVLMWLKSQHI